MKKILSLVCLAAVLCVVGCGGGIKPTGNTGGGDKGDKGGTPAASPSK